VRVPLPTTSVFGLNRRLLQPVPQSRTQGSQAPAVIGTTLAGAASQALKVTRLAISTGPFGLIEAGNFLADRGQASPRECGVGGFERPADLLAAAFEQAIISAR